MLRAFFAISLCFSLLAVQAQDLSGLLSGDRYPVSMKLKDLTSEWKRVKLTLVGSGDGQGDLMKQLMPMMMLGSTMSSEPGGGESGAEAMMGMAFLNQMFGGGDKGDAAYTKGETLQIAGQTFLVTYRIKSESKDFMTLMMESMASGDEPDPSTLFGGGANADSELDLSLVNIASIARLEGIAKFDLEKELESLNKSGSSMFDMFKDMAEGMEGEATIGNEVRAEPVPLLNMSRYVYDSINEDAELRRAGVYVAQSGTKVILTGRVANASQKAKAERMARKALDEMGSNYTIENTIEVKRRR
ncbi:MAG: BON domain-containing protein [Armatimonadetes bacterium]|nr:BON domain-containing protein [Armatimonadota bacterium]